MSTFADDAARRAAVHSLRPYDAVQLASARDDRGGPGLHDVRGVRRQLRAAAATEGFRLVA